MFQVASLLHVADKHLYSLPLSILPVVCFEHIVRFYLNVIIFPGKYKL